MLKLNQKLLPLIFILFVLLFLSSCSNNYQWGWYVISPNNKIGLSNIEFLLGGLKFTIMVSLISMVFAIILGLIVSIAGTTKIKVLNIINIG